jgi:pyruvate/2-oxoacid:ferredoxin oxidoreductase beta subunit
LRLFSTCITFWKYMYHHTITWEKYAVNNFLCAYDSFGNYKPSTVFSYLYFVLIFFHWFEIVNEIIKYSRTSLIRTLWSPENRLDKRSVRITESQFWDFQ